MNGRNTSVGLELCNALKEIAAAQKITMQEIVLKIDRARESRRSSQQRRFALTTCARLR